MSELNVSGKQTAAIINLVQIYNDAKGNKTEFCSLFDKNNYNYNDMNAEDIYTSILKPLDTNKDNSKGKISLQELNDEVTKQEQELKNKFGENYQQIGDLSAKDQLAYFEKKYGDKPTAVQKQAEFSRAYGKYHEAVDTAVAEDVMEDIEKTQEETLTELKKEEEKLQKEKTTKEAKEAATTFGLGNQNRTETFKSEIINKPVKEAKIKKQIAKVEEYYNKRKEELGLNGGNTSIAEDGTPL